MLDNIVLELTLPNMEDIGDMLASYKIKNPDGEIIEIKSYECKKSIPLISSDGYAILPHLVFKNYDEVKTIALDIWSKIRQSLDILVWMRYHNLLCMLQKQLCS